MNDNAKKWVAALRSGEYKQRTGTLGGPQEGYCCLGVACKVYEDETGETLPRTTCGDFAHPGTTSAAGSLDDSVRDFFGLRTDGGDYGHTCLWAQNDAVGKTFDEIADIIESEPDGLFVENVEIKPDCVTVATAATQLGC